MKKIPVFLFALTALILSTVSCNKGENVVLTKAIVTVCGTGSEKCTMNLNDVTVLVPENISTNPYSKEVRALTIYQDKGETKPNDGDTRKYRTVKVYQIDSILTKDAAPDLGEIQNDLVYGTDPVDIYNTWLTVVEDGFVTLHFLGRWGYSTTVHSINLVKDTDSSDPYLFELRHNYNGDDGVFYRDGLVGFNIKDVLAKEKKSSYDISIKFNSHSGYSKTVTFHYIPGASCALGEENSDLTDCKLYK